MILQIKNISKNFGQKKALENVSLTLKDGITGLLGPNGAGKSTLMRLLATVDKPTGGSIKLNGEDLVRRPKVMRTQLGYLPQDFGVYPNLNAVEFLEYMAAIKGLSARSAKKRIGELLEILHLEDAKKRRMGGYSGGMRQRVGIAQALLGDPAVLIVDEPTVGLDPEERISFRNLLASLAENRIIILSTHIVSDIESIAPAIAVLAAGKLVTHTEPETLIAQVDGKVWNLVVRAEELLLVQEQYAVSNAIQRSDGIHVRIVSEQRPSLEVEPVAPTLEDAYLYLTARGNQNERHYTA